MLQILLLHLSKLSRTTGVSMQSSLQCTNRSVEDPTPVFVLKGILSQSVALGEVKNYMHVE